MSFPLDGAKSKMLLKSGSGERYSAVFDLKDQPGKRQFMAGANFNREPREIRERVFGKSLFAYLVYFAVKVFRDSRDLRLSEGLP